MRFGPFRKAPDPAPPPPPPFDPRQYPRTYRTGRTWRALGVAVAVFLAAGGVAMLVLRPWGAPWPDVGVSCALFLVALVAVGDMARRRVVLHADRVERVALSGTRRLRVVDIESWRVVDTQYLAYVRLQPVRGGGRVLKIALDFAPDAAWHAWFGRLRSTDDEARAQSLARVLADDVLGMGPDDRLRMRRRARRIGRVATMAVYAAGLWSIYASRHLEFVAAACLALPLVALALAGARPTLLTLGEAGRGDVRVSLWLALLMGALAPLLVAIKTLALASVVPLVAPAVVLGRSPSRGRWPPIRRCGPASSPSSASPFRWRSTAARWPPGSTTPCRH